MIASRALTPSTLTLRALLAGRAFTEIAPTSDAHCRVSDTVTPAPGRFAAGDASSRKRRSFIRVSRPVPRAPCLRASRFPGQSTFRRDQNSPSLAAMFCRDAAQGSLFPRGARPAHRFTLSPQRGSLPNPAASFGLDTLLLRALSSSQLSDAWMLPSDFCHPIHLYPSAPVPSTLASALRICTRSARGVTGSRRSTRFGGTARAPCKLFTCRSRGDLRHSDASVAVPARPP